MPRPGHKGRTTGLNVESASFVAGEAEHIAGIATLTSPVLAVTSVRLQVSAARDHARRYYVDDKFREWEAVYVE
jgi:hypothetical protein